MNYVLIISKNLFNNKIIIFKDAYQNIIEGVFEYELCAYNIKKSL